MAPPCGPAPTAAPTAVQTELATLVRWREQLKTSLTLAKKQAEHHEQKFGYAEHAKLVRQLESRRAAVAWQ